MTFKEALRHYLDGNLTEGEFSLRLLQHAFVKPGSEDVQKTVIELRALLANEPRLRRQAADTFHAAWLGAYFGFAEMEPFVPTPEMQVLAYALSIGLDPEWHEIASVIERKRRETVARDGDRPSRWSRISEIRRFMAMTPEEARVFINSHGEVVPFADGGFPRV